MYKLLREVSLGLLLSGCCLANAQDSSVHMINHLSFPYKKGYNMHFKGSIIQYVYDDHYTITGKPSETTSPFSFYYHITDEWIEHDDTMVNFYVQQNYVGDTVKMYTSPLLFNDDGMYCWYIPQDKDTETKKDLKKYLKMFHLKNNSDTVWHTISTPLFPGKFWTGLLYDFSEGIYQCISIDSMLFTDLGRLQCICIKSVSVLDYSKDKKVENIFTEFYSDGIGKVYSEMATYLIQNGQILPVSKESATVDKVWWDDGAETESTQK